MTVQTDFVDRRKPRPRPAQPVAQAGDRLAEIRARADKATKGPWWQNSVTTPKQPMAGAVEISSLLCYFSDEGEPRVWDWQGDGEFIANSRQDVPWLLERVTSLEAALRRTEIALQSIAGNASDASTRLVAMAAIRDFRNAVVIGVLPTAAELTGSDPDHTGGLTTQEHMDQIRGVRSDQTREQGD